MTHENRQKALSNFAKRLESVTKKTEAAVDKGRIDDYGTIQYEFNKLKSDFQTFSAECCGTHDQGSFQLGQIIFRFEGILNKNIPLKYI